MAHKPHLPVGPGVPPSAPLSDLSLLLLAVVALALAGFLVAGR